MHALRRLLLTVAAAAGAAISHAGSMRFELPELLGEHELTTVADGFPAGHVVTSATIQTPFYVYHVNSARLVVVGAATAGTMRGDGTTRAADDAAFLPRVTAQPQFYSGASIGHFSMDPPPSVISLDQSYSHPFVPSVTPLPGPGVIQELSAKFDVTLAMYPDSIALNSLPYLTEPDPLAYRRQDEGLTVIEPAKARITEAYLILEGPGVVPEPSGGMLAAMALALPLMRRARVRAAKNFA